MKVSEVMTHGVYTTSPDDSVQVAAQIMADLSMLRHCPMKSGDLLRSRSPPPILKPTCKSKLRALNAATGGP